MVEPLEPGNGCLPDGLLLSPSFVKEERGSTFVPVTNVGNSDVWLIPRRVIATDQITNVLVENDPQLQFCVDTRVVQLIFPVRKLCGELQLDLPEFENLSLNENTQARALLFKCSRVFAGDDIDVECTKLIIHEIPLVDETPVRQPYWGIPPSQYELARNHVIAKSGHQGKL